MKSKLITTKSLFSFFLSILLLLPFYNTYAENDTKLVNQILDKSQITVKITNGQTGET